MSNLFKSQSGYTVYLVLIILSIAAILFSISIADTRAARVFALKEVQRRQAGLLAESGIVRAEYFLDGNDGHSIDWETPGYEERIDTFGVFTLVVERFGLFSRAASTGHRKTATETLRGLFGRTVPNTLAPSLTLTGHIGGLILHNGSRVEGDIVLHHGYVYARKKGNPLPEYVRRLTLRASPPLPFDSIEVLHRFSELERQRTQYLKTLPLIDKDITIDPDNDSLIDGGGLAVAGDCILKSPHVADAVIVVNGTCFIVDGAVLTNVACYADRVIIEGGRSDASLFYSANTIVVASGHHESQFLALDSITVRSDATFGNMAVFAGCRMPVRVDSIETAGGGIFIDEKAGINGTLVCCSALQAPRSGVSPSITVRPGATINGTVVTDGDCSLNGCTIIGRVWARSIVARDESGVYTNYLISTVIKVPPEEQPFVLLGETPLRLVFKQTTEQGGKTALSE